MAGKQLARSKGGRSLEQPYGPSALKAPDNSGSVIMQDAEILFRNFQGRETMYNREGDRNFCVILDPEVAVDMKADGWNVKQLKPREEGLEGDYYIQVSIGYKVKPPRLVLISSKGRTEISQSEIEILDWVDILKADLIIQPYHWKMREGTPQETSGIKAYVKTLFVTIAEDYLELKYSDVPMAEEPLAIEEGDGTAGMDIVEAELVED